MTECVIIINSHSDLTQKTAYTQHPQEQISFKVKKYWVIKICYSDWYQYNVWSSFGSQNIWLSIILIKSPSNIVVLSYQSMLFELGKST